MTPPEAPTPRLRVLYHGNCFDGCASAALMASFYTDCIRPHALVDYRPLSHAPRSGRDHRQFLDDGVNAVVDFRYSRDPRLGWWADHHRSAFADDAERADLATRPPDRFIYDPTAPSCAGLIARRFGTLYGWDWSAHRDLVRWADIIDSASFPDAKTAVELEAPALRVMLVLEGNRDPRFEARVIEWMRREPLEHIAAREEVARRAAHALAAHRAALARIREVARVEDGVVFFDLTDDGVVLYNKFIPYYLWPEATYAVALTRTPTRLKVSVGSNPWRREARRHDIASLCERYGGGGHPAVGAISFEADALEEARRVAAEVVDILRGRRQLAQEDGSAPTSRK